MADGVIRRGDSFPIMNWQLVDASGQPTIDITGASVTLQLVLANGQSVTRTPTVTAPAIARGTYSWVPEDTATRGTIAATFIVNRGGLLQTFPGGPTPIQISVT